MSVDSGGGVVVARGVAEESRPRGCAFSFHCDWSYESSVCQRTNFIELKVSATSHEEADNLNARSGIAGWICLLEFGPVPVVPWRECLQTVPDLLQPRHPIPCQWDRSLQPLFRDTVPVIQEFQLPIAKGIV